MNPPKRTNARPSAATVDSSPSAADELERRTLEIGHELLADALFAGAKQGADLVVGKVTAQILDKRALKCLVADGQRVAQRPVQVEYAST